MPTYYAVVRLKLRNFNPTPDLSPFEPQIGTPVTPGLGNVDTNCWHQRGVSPSPPYKSLFYHYWLI